MKHEPGYVLSKGLNNLIDGEKCKVCKKSHKRKYYLEYHIYRYHIIEFAAECRKVQGIYHQPPMKFHFQKI